MRPPSSFLTNTSLALTCVSLLLLAACGGDKGKADPDRMIELAEELHAKGDNQNAAQFYSQAIALRPGDMKSREKLAILLEADNDNQGAAEQYKAILAASPGNEEDLRSYGRVLLKLNHPQDARDIYASAVKLEPEDTKALNGLGVALDTMGNHDAAQQIYKEALETKPNDITALTNLGHSYVLTGAWDQAIALLEPHAHDEGATPSLRQNLAEAYGMNGMDVDAERMARIDLPAEQVKRNIAFYHQRRLKLAPAASIYADLGSFPTSEMAANFATDIDEKYAGSKTQLTVAVATELTSAGSTPSFHVHVAGFSSAAHLRSFCHDLHQQQIACAEHNLM